MDEKQAALLSQYDLTIYRANRVKGAWLLETDRGLKLFGGCPYSENRLKFEQKIKEHIRKQGFSAVDCYVETKDGNYLVQGPYNECFVLRDWYTGEECDAMNREHVLRTAKTLGRLHRCLTGVAIDTGEQEFCMQPKMTELLLRRNRELRRVRAYIRAKKQKNSFEQNFLNQFSLQYEQAERATALLDASEYENCYSMARAEGHMIHGNFTHHSVLLGEAQTAVTGFQKATAGIQIQDFYLLFRKILEKWDWNVEFGEAMISAYEEERLLPAQERRLLYVLLSYPEKFWKVANQYYNNRKSWIPEKNMKKLVQTMEQAKKREESIRIWFT